MATDEPHLLPELFDGIICLLQYDVTSLRAISLTCKLFHHLARPLLYKFVLVTIRNAQPSTDPTTILPLFDIPGYNPEFTTQMTLRSSAHIILKLSSPSIGLPLDKFTNLHTLTLSRIHLDRFASWPQANELSRRITTLRLHRLYYVVPKDVIKFILAFPSLRCISMHPGQVTRFTPNFYCLGQETPSPALLPPIQCINARFDLSAEYALALLKTLKPKECVKRLSVVTTLANDREFMHLSDAFESFAKDVPIWDLGLNWKENSIFRQSPSDLHFDKLTNLQSLTLSLLGLGTTKKHALNFVFAQYLLSLRDPYLNLRSLTLSFESPSTSRQDIKHTFAVNYEDEVPLGLLLSDRIAICGWLDTSSNKATDIFTPLEPGDTNFWSLWDARLSNSEAFLNLEELVVEVKGLTRARFVVSNPESECEMQVSELKALVMSLFPLTVEKGIDVKVELGSVVREAGLWDAHSCCPSGLS